MEPTDFLHEEFFYEQPVWNLGKRKKRKRKLEESVEENLLCIIVCFIIGFLFPLKPNKGKLFSFPFPLVPNNP